MFLPFNVGSVIGESGNRAVEAATTRVPGALNLERKEHILKITHIPTAYSVTMPAFLDSFSDAYNSQWSESEAFGRMDSIASFGGTRRNISIAWNLPAESFEHAGQNLAKINAIINFLYPLYDTATDRAPVINMDPILRLSFGNLVRDPKTGRGLLGYVNGITFDPVLEDGMFHGKPHRAKGSSTVPHGSSATALRAGQSNDKRAAMLAAGGNPQNNMYFPKTVRLNIEFKVLHEHSLGFAIGNASEGSAKSRATYTFKDDTLNFAKFPYSIASNNAEDKGFSVSGGELFASQKSGDPGLPGTMTAAEQEAFRNRRDARIMNSPKSIQQNKNAAFNRRLWRSKPMLAPKGWIDK